MTRAAARRPVRVPFQLPPYPYDRVAALGKLAAALPGGMVDCSDRHPVRPAPPGVVEALSSSGTERGYPASAGSPALIGAAAAWLERRFGLADRSRTASVAACVGTKELVASVPQSSGCASPSATPCSTRRCRTRPTPWGPRWPGAGPCPVPPRPAGREAWLTGGLDLESIAPSDAARALVLWSNSPSNPTGGLGDLAAEAAWGRAHGVPVFSDECYAEFTWDGPARSVLQSGLDGVVAVHSLSKRSNLAGVRVGFFAGDAELVEFLRSVRRHAGLMVPGPAQAAGAVALADDEHVEVQRARYRERLAFLAGVLTDAGCPVELPEGGSTSGCPCRRSAGSDAWSMAEDLARRAGLLVSPGDLYGDGGAGFVRVAVVQPMDRLELVAERLGDGCGLSSGRERRFSDGRSAAIRVNRMADLQASIEELWERKGELSPKDTDAARIVEEAIELLDSGQARVAEVGSRHR